MSKITALEPQVKHSARFNLYIDDVFVMGLPAIVAAKVHVGQALTTEMLAALEHEGLVEDAREKALRFLEPRPRSTTELKQHLTKKKIAAEVIEAVVTRLTEAGLLDDAAFAKYWVENREAFRPRAGRALKIELKRKGLSNTDIADAVGEIDESESAYRAGVARAQRWHELDQRTFMDKLCAFLIRRGFAYAVAKAAAARLWEEARAE
jgi:regulatory protein